MSNFSAVLVGINKYKNSPLRGCINDVTIMRDILVKKYKVPVSSIRLVLDERATKSNIEERLEWLATNNTENKLFYFSGHGAQIKIQDYSIENYETDGMNELWVPYDMDWKNGNYILDNAINEILSKMKKKHHMTIVSDSCYSGTMDRDIPTIKKLSEEVLHTEIRVKTLPTPLDLMSREGTVDLSDLALGMSLEEAFGIDEVKEVKKSPIKNKNISQHNISVLTGCAQNDTSADAFFNGNYHGALSYFMQGILLREPNISLKDLRKKCALQLNKNRFTQVPQLIASEDNVSKPFIQV